MSGTSFASPTATPTRLRWKFVFAVAALSAVVLAIDVAAGIVLWSRIPQDVKTTLSQTLDDSAGLVLVFAAFMVVALGLLVNVAFRAYVGGMLRLAEGARVILEANPAHRVADDGPVEARALARLIDTFAERQQAAQGDIEQRVREANASVDEEKQRLAALMSELTESVLVCNAEGLILLYNDAARAMFDRTTGSDIAESGIVGLGRSVFGIIDRDLIAHSLDVVRRRLHNGEARPVSQFVATTTGGRLIRAQMAPVRGAEDAGAPGTSGFVLTLDDVTGVVHGGETRDRLLHSLTRDTRAGLATIRAAVETIIGYGAMEPARRDQFTAIIRDEAVRLSERLDQSLGADSNGTFAPWPLEAMKGNDLLQAVTRSIARMAGITATAAPGDDSLWLKVDSFAVVQSFAALATRLARECDVSDFALRLLPGERFTVLELTWRSPGPEATRVTEWLDDALNENLGGERLSLSAVAERHGGEQWSRADRQAGTVTYCMQLPVTAPPSAPHAQPPSARPVFYDFQLFDRPGQLREFEQRALAELAYTVFDTETTGLDPSAGDEIISISAVRVVNGRLLREESFDQLVDPRRALSKESIRIHGITSEMLAGQPTIVQVLPRFARFAEDTVLVGHNVAFDMRFLELKERQTGQRFTQPVLDTLLLSAVVHPNLREHELEANARRLGIPIIGRHTSLGDAIVTGEIFLKLLPLLAAQGVLTLSDALAASRRTYLARVEY